MSFWTPKKTFRLIFWIIQIIFIFVMAWIISSDLLWGAEENYLEEDAWLYEEDEEGNPLIGIDFLTNPPEKPEDYEHISQTYEETGEAYSHSNVAEEKQRILDSTREYAVSSLNQMIEHASTLQFMIQDFSWLDEGSRLDLVTFINEELKYLTEQRGIISDSDDSSHIRNTFIPVYTDWSAFREELKMRVREPFARAIQDKCEQTITSENEGILNTDDKTRKYAAFYAECEDWGRDEEVDIVTPLLEFIKVVE